MLNVTLKNTVVYQEVVQRMAKDLEDRALFLGKEVPELSGGK